MTGGRMHHAADWLSRSRADLVLAATDGCLASAAFAAAMLLRFDGAVPQGAWSEFGSWLPFALLVIITSAAAFGLYGHIWRYAGVQEAQRLLGALLATLTTLGAATTVIHIHQDMPPSVVVLGTGMTSLLMGAVRFHGRLFSLKRRAVAPTTRIVVIGARDAGASLVREMLNSPDAGFLPVALLDPDPLLRGRSVAGVKVLGDLSDLARIAQATRADQTILAMSSPSRGIIRTAVEAAEEADLPLKIVGGIAGRLEGRVGIGDIREVAIDDLIGRSKVETDLASVRKMLAGKRILVTGAGGSIGSEIVRQVARCGPAELIALDHDETHLHCLAASVDLRITQRLTDIRDDLSVRRAFEQYQPEVVFHAAAHKHVPVLEDHPCEAVLTNVVGTDNVVDAAHAVGVERFVFISTDKSVDAVSVMGATKHLGEQIVLAQRDSHTVSTAVRFGNVLGSRGSVVPTFIEQIRTGGPVTVTDPRMTRYFMSIEEAVELVLQSAALADGGDLFVLDMGEPVNILDLAHRMIRLSGLRPQTDIPVRFTGIRPGEKFTEKLLGTDEPLISTSHPAIWRTVPASPPWWQLSATIEGLAALAGKHRSDETRAALFTACGRTENPPDDVAARQRHRLSAVLTTTANEQAAAE